jgi:tagatose-1,6-bisphosphate aldolase
MHEFEKISISEISKKDMLTILEALEYTGKHTNMQTYLELKNNIIKELSALAESSEEEFIEYLKK